MKEQKRQIYRSMQGKEVDMGKLALQNEMTVAVGNVKVNARGDELGPGGKIIKKREEILAESPMVGGVISEPTVRRSTKDIKNMDPEGNE